MRACGGSCQVHPAGVICRRPQRGGWVRAAVRTRARDPIEQAAKRRYVGDKRKQKIVTRLNLPLFDAPIRNDVSGDEGGKAALAQEFDRTVYTGMPGYGSIVARTILFHTLAFNESLKGANEKELLYSVLAPEGRSELR